ncbi:MAG TPA: TIGR03435 family protein [Bryobacteraceae bacterium]|nr:TIGR03435 family protein [Bryobacteraceae bacterium]
MTLRGLPGCFLLLSCVLFAQTQEDPRGFEVASVRIASPGSGRMNVVMRGGPGSSDPGHFYVENSTLLSIIMMAYEAPSFRVSGPSWLSIDRFNITANVPADITRKQFLVMLQNLLAERFRLRVHEEEQLAPAFGLVVDKGGLRMKEATSAPVASGAPESPGFDKDGIAIAPAGQKGLWVNFGGGRFVIQGHQEGPSDLAEALRDCLDQPVMDETGLTARYDFRLEFAPPNVQEDGSAPSIFTAVRQVGLRLEQRKVPAKMIVVDHAERIPAAN